MAYFPFFVDLNGKEGLIVGGGIVALRKVEKLLPYGAKLTVIAENIHPELQENSLIKCLEIHFTDVALEGKTFVIAATDDVEVNRAVAAACHARHIPVNVVDDKENCSFLFPALVKRGDLTVGISTGGASPSAAIYIKEKIEGMLPESLEEILSFLGSYREVVKEKYPVEKRSAALKALFSVCMEKGRPLAEAEANKILEDLA